MPRKLKNVGKHLSLLYDLLLLLLLFLRHKQVSFCYCCRCRYSFSFSSFCHCCWCCYFHYDSCQRDQRSWNARVCVCARACVRMHVYVCMYVCVCVCVCVCESVCACLRMCARARACVCVCVFQDLCSCSQGPCIKRATPTIESTLVLLTVSTVNWVVRRPSRVWESPGSLPGRVLPVTWKMVSQWLPCQTSAVVWWVLGRVDPVSVPWQWERESQCNLHLPSQRLGRNIVSADYVEEIPLTCCWNCFSQ